MLRGREKTHSSPRHKEHKRSKGADRITSFPGRLICFHASLPHNFVHHNRSRDRHVQGRHFSQHRNRNQKVTLLLHQIVQSFTLRTQNQRAIHVVVKGVVCLLSALVKPNRPNIELFQFFHRARNVRHLRNGQVFAGASRGFCDRPRNGRSPPFWNHHSVSAGGVGCS